MHAQISVIMPVYNKGKYIQKAIDSVLSQERIDVELICIDDGSTDNSLALIERNASKDARIKIVRQANAGAGAARNAGLEHSSAEFVSFLDPDDWYPSNNVLSSLYAGAVKSGCPISMGKRLFYVKPFTFKRKDNLLSEGIHHVAELSSAFLYQSCIFKRSLILENDIRFPSYRRFQDPPFFLRVVSATDAFFFLDDYVHCYRRGIQKIAWNNEKLIDYACGTFDALRLANAIGNRSIFSQVLDSLNHASFTEGAIEANSDLVFDLLCKIQQYVEETLAEDCADIRALRLKRNNNVVQKCFSMCALRVENGVKSVF